MFEINIAIAMLAVTVALFIWFQRSEASASDGRLKGMLTRVGLNPKIVGLNDVKTTATVNQVRRRCRKCSHEDYCDRWLAGSVEGDNSFCPNAQSFSDLT